MGANGIPLDNAELLSVLLEAVLYGFSLLMFGATIWALLFHRCTDQVNRKMLAVGCALLLCSTAHLIIDIVRITEGLILYRDTHPGGPVAYFADVSQWTFVSKSYLFALQTLIGDGVVLYRCYVVWQSKLVMVLPVLLWCATLATGIGSPYTASRVRQSSIFSGALSQWIVAFWATELVTNVLTTSLLVFRIWYIDRKASRLRRHQQSLLRPILRILVDAGVIYSLTLLVVLICFASQSNGQYLILDTVTPIISITFYMVIIRIGLAARASHATPAPFNKRSTEDDVNAERRRTLIHITHLAECRVDTQCSFGCLMDITTSHETPPREVISNDVGEIETV